MKSLTLLALALVALSASASGSAHRGAAAPRIARTPAYDIAVRLLPDDHHVEVSGTVALPSSNTPRVTLEFMLSALMTNLRVEILEPAESAGPAELNQAESRDPQSKLTHWVVRAKRPLAADAPVRLHFAYDGGEGISFTYYIGPEGSFAGQNSFWYPQFKDTRGTGRIAFMVPRGYTVLSTGRSDEANAAAGRFEFINSVPTRFAFAAGQYTVVDRAGVVPMRVYLLHPRSTAGEYLGGASKVLSVLSREFGPYPYRAFSIAEVPTEQAREAGFSGASMNGFMLVNEEGLDAPFNLAFYGHEIGHQWWANLVTHTDDEHGAYMLDEALAQYGSLRVVETVEGAVAAEQYRRTGYPGYNSAQCGYGYLLSTGMGRDHALEDLPDDNWSHELADSKGFLVWDLLSRTIGRDRFRKALHDVTREYAFRGIRWDEFLAVVQRAAGQNLRLFFAQWFGRAGAPEWQIEWQQQGEQLHGKITQSAPPYRQRLQVELTGINGERAVHTIEVQGAETDFSWDTSFRIRSVVLDPHFVVLHWMPELRGGAMARGPALRGFQLTDAGKFDEAESELRKALANLPVPDLYGARYWTEYSLAYMFMARQEWTEAERHLDAALAAPSRDSETLPFLYWRYARVAKSLNDEVKLRWAVDGAVTADAATGGKGAAPYLARALLTPSQ